MKYHLVILKKPYLDLILSGQKTVELRLTKTKHPAFGRIGPGDRLFLKVSAGPVCAAATVGDVKCYQNLTPEKISRIKQRFNEEIKGGDAIWQSKKDCQYGFLVWLEDVWPIEPVRIDKKDWRAWVVLTPGRDFGLLAGHRQETTAHRASPS